MRYDKNVKYYKSNKNLHIKGDVGILDLCKRKEQIVMNLVNTSRNRGLLKAVPHKDVMDLSILYRVIVGRGNAGMRMVLVTNAMLEELGLSQNEISVLAYRNTLRMFPARVSKFSDRLYMMTNSAKVHGATVMVYRGMIEALSRRLGGNLFIIPSSVHEVMIVPESSVDLSFLRRALADNNRFYVEKQDVLSDCVYFYSQTKKMIGIAHSSASSF